MKRLKSVHLVYDIDDGNACYTDTLAYDGKKYKNNEALLEDVERDIRNIIKHQLEES